MDIIERQRNAAAAFGSHPLLVSPDGQVISLAEGYIPLLANFTFEDKAAKGLRKRCPGDKPEPPVYFSVVELVRDNKILLLSGPCGSGKTSFAKHLCFSLATTGSIRPHSVARNESGTTYDEYWEPEHILPCYFIIDSPESLKTLIDKFLPTVVRSLLAKGQATSPSVLIVLDKVETAGTEGPSLFAALVAFAKGFENIKVVLLGETSGVKHWILPSDVTRHDLLSLLEIQRRQAVSILTRVALSKVEIGIGAAGATPAYFALALEAKQRGDVAEELLEAWLAVVAPEKDASSRISAQACDHFSDKSLSVEDVIMSPMLFFSRAIQQLLAARHLVNLPLTAATTLFHRNPSESEPVLRSVLTRLRNTGKSVDLVEALIQGSGIPSQLGALLVSDFIADSSKVRAEILSQMLAIIEQGSLPVMQREKAGRVLSRLGDTRDLTALTNIPAGDFILGLSLESFRIGLFPVVNRDFSMFIKETGRDWQSPDGFTLEKQNAPATDLTWYDAVAYCEWLTSRWHLGGKLSPNEHVRLPTEPEWERASRGDQILTKDSEVIYPWGTEWQDDAANFEESGLNATCSVGLFPKGRTTHGCYDMAGQVWEWCTTLWGDNMTTPSFQYPWRNDGRENMDAPGSIRRVLRGGCFSSGRLKVCCTYRGSLEPAGFWRGNGFRIVVAKVPSE
ncbi:serine/threonine protein kinase [Halenospora varia]|nr:serine/threonine protein kinase [Halenospora varia]